MTYTWGTITYIHVHVYAMSPKLQNQRLKWCSLICTPNTCKCILKTTIKISWAHNHLGETLIKEKSPNTFTFLKEAAKYSNQGTKACINT